MARTKKQRLIERAPNFTGFKPFGVQNTTDVEVCITFEEYEAIKLCDYDLLKHEDAATLMNISRSTFSRIYESARRKIAKAFVDVCTIQLDGGSASLYPVWLKCSHCNISFLETPGKPNTCPLCGFVEQSVNKEKKL
ncbi:MAG: DUF134 domain-containing protein [Bacteroidetes bacterium]|nr:DUF134 domain-containing protein [Bacteroidota bacterium]